MQPYTERTGHSACRPHSPTQMQGLSLGFTLTQRISGIVPGSVTETRLARLAPETNTEHTGYSAWVCYRDKACQAYNPTPRIPGVGTGYGLARLTTPFIFSMYLSGHAKRRQKEMWKHALRSLVTTPCYVVGERAPL